LKVVLVTVAPLNTLAPEIPEVEIVTPLIAPLVLRVVTPVIGPAKDKLVNPEIEVTPVILLLFAFKAPPNFIPVIVPALVKLRFAALIERPLPASATVPTPVMPLLAVRAPLIVVAPSIPAVPVICKLPPVIEPVVEKAPAVCVFVTVEEFAVKTPPTFVFPVIPAVPLIVRLAPVIPPLLATEPATRPF